MHVCPFCPGNELLQVERSEEKTSGLVQRKCNGCGKRFILERHVIEELVLIREPKEAPVSA